MGETYSTLFYKYLESVYIIMHIPIFTRSLNKTTNIKHLSVVIAKSNNEV